MFGGEAHPQSTCITLLSGTLAPGSTLLTLAPGITLLSGTLAHGSTLPFGPLSHHARLTMLSTGLDPNSKQAQWVCVSTGMRMEGYRVNI